MKLLFFFTHQKNKCIVNDVNVFCSSLAGTKHRKKVNSSFSAHFSQHEVESFQCFTLPESCQYLKVQLSLVFAEIISLEYLHTARSSVFPYRSQ